ncbi:VRR-NUC domain-containing protein [Niabella aurantiaca]|uniref:VRR-NUC domain-containing protein n=1 Tax=Niabella aurantiaca TaxID=379900 RepID=UPI000378C25B|nr:VRR-NUC domain-containing protein [Niabella aurantiaca]
MLESAIQSKIIKRLEKSGWIVIKLIQTTKNGIHDIIALKNSKAVFIEVKKPGETPSDLQKYRHRKIREAGFDSFWVDNVDDEQLFKYYK